MLFGEVVVFFIFGLPLLIFLLHLYLDGKPDYELEYAMIPFFYIIFSVINLIAIHSEKGGITFNMWLRYGIFSIAVFIITLLCRWLVIAVHKNDDKNTENN